MADLPSHDCNPSKASKASKGKLGVHNFHIRISGTTFDRIQAAATGAGIKPTNWAREAIHEKLISTIGTENGH